MNSRSHILARVRRNQPAWRTLPEIPSFDRPLADPWAAFYRAPEWLAQLIAKGALGQKTGAGFFAYKDAKGRGEPDPKLAELLAPLITKKEKLSKETITNRLFLPMVLEAVSLPRTRADSYERDQSSTNRSGESRRLAMYAWSSSSTAGSRPGSS